MSSQSLAAIVAIAGGIALAAVLFIPMAAVRYRRIGRLALSDVATLVAVTIYGLALWTYTLLPLPGDDDFTCKEPITRLTEIADGVRAHDHSTVLELARNPMVLQVVLNVVLFVPLGFLLRARLKRGVVVAALAGLGVSLLIEVTQYTGIWGVYRCAYRYFDVGDLVANPTGAVAGSILAAIVVGRRPEGARAVEPELTAGRRLVSLVSDLLVMFVLGSIIVIGWRAWLLGVRHVPVSEIDPGTQALVQWGVPLALQAVAVLGFGRTVGEVVVQVRTRARRVWWTVPGRLVKLATGVGALAALGAWNTPGSGWVLLALVGLHPLAAVFTRDGRGLSNTLAGLDVELTGTATEPRAATGPVRSPGQGSPDR